MLSRFIQRAPESFLSPAQIKDVAAGRRGFLASAFVAAGLASSSVAAQTAKAGEGDPNILNLPAHTKGLGQPVAARPYGLPSEFEKNLQRRESPGLTRVGQASVSFCPLQGLFGIITPSGLHFERHHQGWRASLLGRHLGRSPIATKTVRMHRPICRAKSGLVDRASGVQFPCLRRL